MIQCDCNVAMLQYCYNVQYYLKLSSIVTSVGEIKPKVFHQNLGEKRGVALFEHRNITVVLYSEASQYYSCVL